MIVYGWFCCLLTYLVLNNMINVLAKGRKLDWTSGNAKRYRQSLLEKMVLALAKVCWFSTKNGRKQKVIWIISKERSGMTSKLMLIEELFLPWEKWLRWHWWIQIFPKTGQTIMLVLLKDKLSLIKGKQISIITLVRIWMTFAYLVLTIGWLSYEPSIISTLIPSRPTRLIHSKASFNARALKFVT